MLLRFLYSGLLPCTQALTTIPESLPTGAARYECIAAHSKFVLPLHHASPAYLEVEHRAFGLGLPKVIMRTMSSHPSQSPG